MFTVDGEDRYVNKVFEEFDDYCDAMELAYRIRKEGGWAAIYDDDGLIEVVEI